MPPAAAVCQTVAPHGFQQSDPGIAGIAEDLLNTGGGQVFRDAV